MRILRTIAEVRAVVAAARRAGTTIGLVPTMGGFHEGHLSLIRAARDGAGLVVVSLFVNPTQFGANEDLGAYPRDETRDAGLAEAAGADILFAPAVSEIYPAGFATSIHVSGITDVLCGARRGPHHFDGVATVVAKLFGIVSPDVAYFGQKDAQQVLVVRRLVRDLDIPVRIEARPIVREPDGLAMSSRNAYLTPDQRAAAVALPQAMRAAIVEIESGVVVGEALSQLARTLLASGFLSVDYAELCDAADLTVLTARSNKPMRLLVAARIGKARLIDNMAVAPI